GVVRKDAPRLRYAHAAKRFYDTTTVSDASSRTVSPRGCAPTARTPRLGRRHELRTKAEHFLDVRGVRVKRLDQRFAGKNVRLLPAVQVVHDALAHPSLGIAKAHDRSGADLDPRNASRIGNGVSLSHGNSVLSAALVSLTARWRARRRARNRCASSSRRTATS